MDLVSQSTQSVSRGLSEIQVPVGHIVISGRWRNIDLAAALQSCTTVHFDDSMNIVDFHPSSHTGVIYVSESDIVTGSGYRRKVAKLRKADKVRGVVIAERTPASDQYYRDLQKFCMLAVGFVLLPVGGQEEAAALLAQMVEVESKSMYNPLLKKPRHSQAEIGLLSTLQCIPKLGEVKAKQLLMHFGSLQRIATADLDMLSKVVGRASAKNIKEFLS